MSSALTGERKGATSKVRCVDTAALIACAMLRKCPTATVLAFDTSLYSGPLDGSVVTSAATLAKFGGGGTDCSLPIRYAAEKAVKCDALVLISDNESWVNTGNRPSYVQVGGRIQLAQHGTPAMQYWRQVQQKNPNAKLVCIDLTPNATRQTTNESSIANVGGFSDAVFDFISVFLTSNKSWTEVVDAVDIGVAAR
jgi:60 kDa SS-A/Ro ribonucleoprotein